MKFSSKFLKEIIREEMSRFDEGCGEIDTSGDECPVCAAGLECPCDDEEGLGDFSHDSHDHDSELTSIPVGTITGVEGGEPDLDRDGFSPDELLFNRDEALRVVSAIAQNTSCPITRDALMGVVNDLSDGAGEEWSLEDDEHESEPFEDAHSETSHGGWSDWAVSGGRDFDVPDKRLEGG